MKYDYLDKVEEQFYDDEHEFRELRITLARAHMLDDKIYDGKKIKVKNPKYLSETQKQELLEKLEKEIEETGAGKDLTILTIKCPPCFLTLTSGVDTPL